MLEETLKNDSRNFLEWAATWYRDLSRLSMEELAVEPDRTVILSVDLLRGFCYEGPLSSPRVAAIIGPIVRVFERAYELGVRRFVLPQENHPPDAIEFDSFGPHCIAGTSEAETVPELAGLSFADQFVVIKKNSINAFIETGLEGWLDANSELRTFIVTGDCTDLCVYQLAMQLRVRANARQLKGVRVIVPADCVDTYHLDVSTAEEIGAVPHDADLMHIIFLYHMMLNGVEVVAGLDA
ncbi:MAG: cysteine hydrolase [Anaerolineales bacterium]|nr:cysteine hydrolase [Anaerolineales bacterium]